MKRELPLLLGLIGAWALLTEGGWAFHTARGAVGTSWFHYREAAHIMMHPDESGMSWPMWRNNLYPWMLGWMGERWGFSEAASWISSTATLGIALGAGLAARALATPWVGAVTMVLAVSIPFVCSGVHLMDVHPTLGAAFALAIGLGLCAARWPRWSLVAATGLVAGLALGLDERGTLAVVMSMGLVLIGGWHRGWRRMLLMGLLFGVMASLGPALEGSQRSTAQVSLAEDGETTHLFGQLERQAIHTVGDIEDIARWDPTSPLADACADGVPLSLGDALTLGPCTRAIWSHNTGKFRRQGSLPPAWLLFLLPLALLPARWGRRSTLAAALVLGPSTVAIVTMLGMVLVGDRYFAPFVVAMATFGPVAVHRIVALVTPRLTWASAVGGLAVGCLIWPTLPTQADMRPEPPAIGGKIVPWLLDHMDREDTLFDCSGENLTLHFLPWNVLQNAPEAHQQHLPRVICGPIIRGAVQGTQWLVLGPRPARTDPKVHGWTRVMNIEGSAIFRRTDQE
jgi:MFS family permease